MQMIDGSFYPSQEERDLAIHTDNGFVLYNVHSFDKCKGEPCIIHNPSKHKLDKHSIDWSRPVAERICNHGIGHPDPDALAFKIKSTGQNGWALHGCDGCCGKA